MPQAKLNITCRIEELPSIGGFLIASLQTDIDAFSNFSPDFGEDYFAAATEQLLAVTALIQPRTITAELKVITLRMYQNMNDLGPQIDFLQGYIKRTTGLTVAAADFGISAIRQANKNGDVEALIDALSYTLNLATNATNAPLLLAKGFTNTRRDALLDIKTQLAADNILQNVKLNERNNLVTGNYAAINNFWKTLMDISDTGKIIFRNSNKKDDYTVAQLLRRIRNENTRNRFTGTITSAGSPLNQANIELVPIAGGRRRTTKSKATGLFEIKNIVEAEYIVNVTANGKVAQTTTITATSGQTVTQNFDLINA